MGYTDTQKQHSTQLWSSGQAPVEEVLTDNHKLGSVIVQGTKQTEEEAKFERLWRFEIKWMFQREICITENWSGHKVPAIKFIFLLDFYEGTVSNLSEKLMLIGAF